MFRDGTVSSPARAVCIFKFIPYICKHGGFNCDGHRRYVNSILYVPPEEMKWCVVTGTRRPNDRVACANPFPRKLSTEKVPPELQCANAKTLGPFFQNRHKEFLQRPGTVHHTSHQGRRLRVASGATAPGPVLEGAPRFRPMSLSSYILR